MILSLVNLRIYRVLGDEPVEITPGDLRLLRGQGDVATGLGQEARDGLALEELNRALLGVEEAFLTRYADRAPLLEVERQMRQTNLSGRCEDDRALDDVLELAQVARPRIARQEIERFGGESVDLLIHLRLGLAQEVVGEDGDVLGALAQPGERDRERVE